MGVQESVGWPGYLIAGALACFAACSTSESKKIDDGDQRFWRCASPLIEGDCRCEHLRPDQPGSFNGPSEPVAGCGIAQTGVCCFLTEGGPAPPSCECAASQASCEAEAASRPGTRLSESCPPGLTPPPVVCAKEGQNCRPSYLEQNGIQGCCDGLLCAVNAGGVPVCTPASPEDLELDRVCREAPGLTIQDPLTMEGAAIQFNSLRFSLSQSGPGGCLAMVDWALTREPSNDPTACLLSFEAGPEADANGLIVHDVLASLEGCPDWPFGDTFAFLDSDTVDGRLRFVGRSCEVDDGQYCVGGTFELTLNGVFDIDSRRVPLTGAPIRLTGRECPFTQAASCPTF